MGHKDPCTSIFNFGPTDVQRPLARKKVCKKSHSRKRVSSSPFDVEFTLMLREAIVQKIPEFYEKTPSKIDVAPWNKHWIKRELDGFGLYPMVFVQIQWYSMIFVEI